MEPVSECEIPFRGLGGKIIGRLRIVSTTEPSAATAAPLVRLNSAELNEFAESEFQLREGECYEYELRTCAEDGLVLRSSLSARRRSLAAGAPDAGRIETRSYCGTLALEVVRAATGSVVATEHVEVRSVKLNYRTEYRGMLRRLSAEMLALVADARSSAKLGVASNWARVGDRGMLQFQLELLRKVILDREFSLALDRILLQPHESARGSIRRARVDELRRVSARSVNMLLVGAPRVSLPISSPLRSQLHVSSVASHVDEYITETVDDTPESRFVKFALSDFKQFLAELRRVLRNAGDLADFEGLIGPLDERLDDWLSRPFLRRLGDIRILPLSSPVLQRKPGYREVLRAWLRFRSGFTPAWPGASDVFLAGQRDLATLYEYWLFFELLDWFCSRCCGGKRPPPAVLLDGLSGGAPFVRLQKRIQLGPLEGVIEGKHRRLSARFSYNRVFAANTDRSVAGSWTRRLHPDYTFSFWPFGLTEEEAEAGEQLVHLHFDAKYRVETVDQLFGTDEEDEQPAASYKRQDLLKMHAYRDAIRRSQGAYVLYPGTGAAPARFQGFHEVLPGLGAFSVGPRADGTANGMAEVASFLEEVISQLSDRISAQEQLSVQLSRIYGMPSPHGNSVAPAVETLSADKIRRPRVGDEHVLIDGLSDTQTLRWSQRMGRYALPLRRQGTLLRLPPVMSDVRHVVITGSPHAPLAGLLRLRSVGHVVLDGAELRADGHPIAEGGTPYAVFDVEAEPEFIEQAFDISVLQMLAQHVELPRRFRVLHGLGESVWLLPLAELKAVR